MSNIRVRNTPAGPGDQMSNGEVQAMIDGCTSQPNGSSAEPPENPGSGDDDMDIDNPPVRPGPNATTVGFELECLVAVARGKENLADPHPNDLRWLSDDLIKFNSHHPPLQYTARNKIIDELVQAGVVAHKTPEYSFYKSELEWWDSFEYELPNQNDPYIGKWMGGYAFDRAMSQKQNIAAAVDTLKDQFLQYHEDHNLEVYMTRREMLKEARDRIPLMITGRATQNSKEKMKALWYEQMNIYRNDARARHYISENNKVSDPNLPAIAHKWQYRAWSCTEDATIVGNLPLVENYEIPPRSLPIDPSRPCFRVEPKDAYKWFGAEIVSSILDYDNPETHVTLRKVCETVRNALRVHKPLARVETGVHVHIGQQAGWTILHLKKFAVLWHLLEASLFKLHRRGRSSTGWCDPMSTKCTLAWYVFEIDPNDTEDREYLASLISPTKTKYMNQMKRFIPPIRAPKLNEFIFIIWQYENIDDLNKVMQNTQFSNLGAEVSLRWRCTGSQLSLEDGGGSTQTIEFRLMQGTLDADHIWKWAGILERIVIFARDSTPGVFRDTIQNLVDGNLPDSIGFNQQDLAWFASRRTDGGYFSYPDNGKVNWADPFMVPGYGDTHQ